MNTTAVATYCPECGDEFEMVSTTIWVNGKRFHEDCHRRATIAAKDTEIFRLRHALVAIASPTQTDGLPWWQKIARDALNPES